MAGDIVCSDAAEVNGTGRGFPMGSPTYPGHWSNTIGNHNNLTDPQGAQGGDDEAAPRNRAGNARRQQAAAVSALPAA